MTLILARSEELRVYKLGEDLIVIQSTAPLLSGKAGVGAIILTEAIYPEPSMFRENTSTLKLPGRRVLTSRDDSPCRTMKEFLCDYNVPFLLWSMHQSPLQLIGTRKKSKNRRTKRSENANAEPS